MVTKSFARVPRRARAGAQLVEEQAPEPPVDRSPVVRIDQQLVPQLVALVQIGHPRRRAPQRQHPEGTAVGRGHHLGQEREERLPEARVRGDTPGRLEDVVLPRRIAVHPARVALGLAQGFHQVAVEALARDRPRAHERLEHEELLVVVGRARAPVLVEERAPVGDEAAPVGRHPRECADARTRVGAPLRVVRGRGQQRARPVALPALARGVELVDGEPEAIRVAADLVEREQARVPVHRGVLDTLGHDRARRLLEPHDELGRRAVAVADRVGDVVGQARQRARVVRRALARLRVDVRAVHGERRERGLEMCEVGEAPQPAYLGCERHPHLLGLGLDGDGREVRVRAGGGVEVVSPGRIHEQRVGVDQELVAGGPLDRPPRQRLTRFHDLLHPDVPDAGVAQPLQVPARVGEAVDVVDPHTGDDAGSHQLQQLGVGGREHLRVLDPHPGQVVDVEEAPVATRRVEVEEARPQRLVAPERVLVARRHVVGHDVDDEREPLGGQRVEGGFSAQRVGDALSGRRRRNRASSLRAPASPGTGTGG